LLSSHVDAIDYELISEVTTYDKAVERSVCETTEYGFCTTFAEGLQIASRRDTRAIRVETQVEYLLKF